MFRTRTKSRSVPSPSDTAGEPPRLNLIRPAPSRDAFDRERVYGAGITGETRLVHPRVGVAESRFSFANKSHSLLRDSLARGENLLRRRHHAEVLLEVLVVDPRLGHHVQPALDGSLAL